MADPQFPWEAYMQAVQQKNQNRNILPQLIGQALASGGDVLGKNLERKGQVRAQSAFGQALNDLNAPVQGPPSLGGEQPKQIPPNFGNLYALAGRAFGNQAPEIMPAIIKEFGTGADSKSQIQQDKLEKEYRDQLNKIVNSRSGGLGLQDAKVNQAIDLRTMINQTYDPETGRYNIPPSLHSELVLGLARLVSPNGQVGIQLEDTLRQKTAREGVAGALIYLGLADPKKVGGSTQDVAKLFIDSIDRQGTTAEKLRDTYLKGLRSRYPTRLDPKRREFLEQSELGSSFDELLKNSPDYGRKQKTNPLMPPSIPGMKTSFETKVIEGKTYEKRPDGWYEK